MSDTKAEIDSSNNEQISKRWGFKLNRASDAIDRKSDDVYAHVAGALYRVFLTLAIQATRAYFIFAIKLFVWSIIPLTTIIAILLQVAPLSPTLIVICYGAIGVIIWTVITLIYRSFYPLDESKINKSADAEDITKPARNKFFKSISMIFSALVAMIIDLFRGRIKPLFTLGFFIRVIGLASFLFLSYAHEFLGWDAVAGFRWLKNEIYWLEFGIFDAIVAQPIFNVINFIVNVASSFGIHI